MKLYGYYFIYWSLEDPIVLLQSTLCIQTAGHVQAELKDRDDILLLQEGKK